MTQISNMKVIGLEMACARQENCLLNPFVHRRTAVAHSEPTKGFQGGAQRQPCCLHPLAFPKRSPETAMLSAPLECTHPPHPSLAWPDPTPHGKGLVYLHRRI